MEEENKTLTELVATMSQIKSELQQMNKTLLVLSENKSEKRNMASSDVSAPGRFTSEQPAMRRPAMGGANRYPKSRAGGSSNFKPGRPAAGGAGTSEVSEDMQGFRPPKRKTASTAPKPKTSRPPLSPSRTTSSKNSGYPKKPR
jgi:hypothetical protein